MTTGRLFLAAAAVLGLVVATILILDEKKDGLFNSSLSICSSLLLFMENMNRIVCKEQSRETFRNKCL